MAARCTETALHLITLGARVDTPGKDSKLPIDHFVEHFADTFNAKLFICLLPSRTKGENILRPICQLVQNADCNLYELPNAVVLQMIQQLIQRLHFEGPIKVFISLYGVGTRLTINNDDCFHDWHMSVLVPYMCSLMLTELQFDLLSTSDDIVLGLPDQSTASELIARAHAIDDLWRTYRQKCKVKSLLRLCILRTRKSMSSLDDNSFLSLPGSP